MSNSKEIEEEIEERTRIINGFRNFSIVAKEYFPKYATADAASRRMRTDIELDPVLFEEMKAAHYVHGTTRLSPKQQQILFKTWGPGKIIIPNTINNPKENEPPHDASENTEEVC